MPWESLESPENREKLSAMKALIAMRKGEAACRSPHFHFPGEYEQERMVEYIKLDQEGRELEVLLNCSSDPIGIREGGEILFSRGLQGDSLLANGSLIRRKRSG